MSAVFPAKQNMISSYEEDAIRKHLDMCLRTYECPPDECWIDDVETVPEWSVHKGYKTQYRLMWTTYRGWKVYMLMTGCMASDSRYE